jgi:hypothetical protein
MEASKELVGELLIDLEGAPVRKYELEELVPVLEKYKYMSCPSIKNDISAFRYIRRFGIMDGIAALRGYSHWTYVQENKFPGQDSDSDKVFVFKMLEVGPGSGYTWSNECNLEEIWRTRGSCSITSSVSSNGPPWLTMSMTPHIVES